MLPSLTRSALALLLISLAVPGRAAKPSYYSVGVASVDITPDYPVRLSGYGSRQKESEGIDERIYAKALAIGTDRDGPALLVAVDNVAVPACMRDELAARLAKKTRVRNERLTVCSMHVHTAPMLTGVCPCLFGGDIPPEHQARIERYTRELTRHAVPRTDQRGLRLEPPAPGRPRGP